MTRSNPTSRRSGASAYTLLEVMLALGIFVIGFAAVASIFPAAAILQKATVEDAVSQQFVRSATALLEGRQLSTTDLDSGTVDYSVHPLPASLLYGASPKWTASDRSSPSIVTTLDSRSYYWVPLVRRKAFNNASTPKTAAGDWEVFIFCLKREDNTTYDKSSTNPAPAYPGTPGPGDSDPNIPGVFNTAATIAQSSQVPSTVNPQSCFVYGGPATEINAGDQVLDNNGTIYNVIQKGTTNGNLWIQIGSSSGGQTYPGFILPGLESGQQPTSLWYGRPGISTNGNSTASPTRRLVVVSNAVK